MRLRSLAQRVLAKAVRDTDLDLTSCRGRLGQLGARHAELSAVLSLDDNPPGPSDRLLALLPALCAEVRTQDLAPLAERNPPTWVHVWPGEHYRLLPSLIRTVAASRTVEIGTFTGLGTLAMLAGLPPDGSVVTFDIVPWQECSETFLRSSDFNGRRLRQVVADLGDQGQCYEHAALLKTADLIFVDAAKDGKLEQRILDNFATIGLRAGTLLMFDDIRLWNMLKIWRRIPYPKMDVTSLGHWSGTGLVDWTGPRS